MRPALQGSGKYGKEESFRIKIAFKRDKDYAETVGSLNALIDRCASSLKKVLGYHTINPLEIDAFCIENGKVIVSPLWFDEKIESTRSNQPNNETWRKT